MTDERTEGSGAIDLVRQYWQSVLGMLIAGAATCAITYGGYENYRDNGSLMLDMAGVALTLILWLAVGVAAGFVSGHLRDVIGSWVASVAGVVVAYAAFYLVIHPEAVYPSEGGFRGDIVSIAVFLAGFISIGHVVGVYAREYLEGDEGAELASGPSEPAPAADSGSGGFAGDGAGPGAGPDAGPGAGAGTDPGDPTAS
jgi:hypothetical protein